MTFLIDYGGCWEHCVQKDSPAAFQLNKEECCDHSAMSAVAEVEEVTPCTKCLSSSTWNNGGRVDFCLKCCNSCKALLHYSFQSLFPTANSNINYKYRYHEDSLLPTPGSKTKFFPSKEPCQSDKTQMDCPRGRCKVSLRKQALSRG